MEIQYFHQPVLWREVIDCLNIIRGKWYIDATAGSGGHTEGILDKGGNVLAIDRDENAIKYLHVKFNKQNDNGNIRIVQGNFRDINKFVTDIGDISGIIFDLGLSTYQIKNSGRGFSFKLNEPLDMRMGKDIKVTATDIINKYSEDNLYEIFIKYGEEKLARQLAHAILRARNINPITTTGQLQHIAEGVYDDAGIRGKIDPATKIFQALRIELNKELENLRIALPKAINILADQGRLVVISFHSLEDRIVKKIFNEAEKNQEIAIVNRKPITAREEEIRTNPASRSAKLRSCLKIRGSKENNFQAAFQNI